MAWIAAAIAAAASIGGGIMGNNAASRALDKQQAQHADDLAWMERMSNTAHQREVTDLRAAGLNPILSAKYGGASTPVTGTPQIVPNMALSQGVKDSASSAISAYAAARQVENVEADTEQKRAQAGLLREQQTLTGAQTYNTVTNSQLTNAELNQRREKLSSEIAGMQSRSELDKARLEEVLVDTMNKRYMTASAKADAVRAAVDEYFYSGPIGRAARMAELGGKALPNIPLVGILRGGGSSAKSQVGPRGFDPKRHGYFDRKTGEIIAE